MANTHCAGLRLQIVTDDPSPFAKWYNAVGPFHGAGDYLAVVVDPAMAGSRLEGDRNGEEILGLARELGMEVRRVDRMMDKSRSRAYMRPGEKLVWAAVLK